MAAVRGWLRRLYALWTDLVDGPVLPLLSSCSKGGGCEKSGGEETEHVAESGLLRELKRAWRNASGEDGRRRMGRWMGCRQVSPIGEGRDKDGVRRVGRPRRTREGREEERAARRPESYMREGPAKRSAGGVCLRLPPSIESGVLHRASRYAAPHTPARVTGPCARGRDAVQFPERYKCQQVSGCAHKYRGRP